MNLATNSMVEPKIVQYIANQYHPLDYSPSLKALIKTAFPENSLDGVTKYELHVRLNSLIFDNYNGEQIFKYLLFKEYFSKQDVVGAFEIKVNNSRADFLTINGHSSCFEIKTALDNFSKFPKQASDYMKAFQKGNQSADGSGLGLTIVQQAVNLHKGQVEIGRSAAGGARVVVTFD